MNCKLKERVASLLKGIEQNLPKDQKTLANELQRCFGEIRQEQSAMKDKCEAAERAKAALLELVAEERRQAIAAETSSKEARDETKQARKEQRHAEGTLRQLQQELDAADAPEVFGFHLIVGGQVAGTVILAGDAWLLPCLVKVHRRQADVAEQAILTMPTDAAKIQDAIDLMSDRIDLLCSQTN